MIEKLVRIGDDLAVVLDKPLLEELGLDENSEVELFTNGYVLAASPREKHRDLLRVVEELDQQYGGVFQAVATQ